MSSSANTASLRSRVLRAGGWTLGGYFLAQVIRLGSSLIMTRLLVPEMFGLMAIVYVLMTGLAMFSDIGLTQIIIQSRRGEDPDFQNTAWVIQIVRGALIWLAALVLSAALPYLAQMQALPIGGVYTDPLLPSVIAIFMSVALIGGFASTKIFVARRKLNLTRNTQIEIISQVAALSVMIPWAMLDRSIWALVGGGIAGSLVRTLLSHAMLPGPSNRWIWDRSAFKEIIGFGKWIFPASILSFLIFNGDRLLLGGLVNVRLLGIYSIAYLIVSSLQGMITNLISAVAFPALSEVVRENPTQLQATYYKLRLIFDGVILSIAGVLLTFGSSLIRMLYDARYLDAGAIVEVLAWGMIATRYTLTIQCYNAMGKPGAHTTAYVVQALSLYLLVPAAFHQYQFDGAIWAIALCPFLSLPVTFYYKKKYQLLNVRKELIVLPFFIVGACAGELLSLIVKWLLN